LKTFLEQVSKLWPLFATLGLLGGIIWYFAVLDSKVRTFEGRISAIETQLHMQAIVPFVEKPEMTKKSTDASSLNQAETMPNPIAGACKTIADLIAEDLRAGFNLNAENKREMLRSLGCLSPGQGSK